MATVREARLPAEARRTLDLVDAGGPFPYEPDGAVFGNFEGLLPRRQRGSYHEYTVRTPGSTDRGAGASSPGGAARPTAPTTTTHPSRRY
ncbi:guanyl-specific ribonuclease Sa [Streptomyces albaduncus]|uniref:Guanyl-specific ribonuclease Sa n=1 Tax=Streptomyces griseoloalbus TaxID=67303 RepID=A0A7W8BT90_9ACTN|nr:guanyl-specific ribonuclease Sa [Streptomyces albaduncus]